MPQADKPAKKEKKEKKKRKREAEEAAAAEAPAAAAAAPAEAPAAEAINGEAKSSKKDKKKEKKEKKKGKAAAAEAAADEEPAAAAPQAKKRKTDAIAEQQAAAAAADEAVQQAAEPQADGEEQEAGGKGGRSDGGYGSSGKEGTAARAFQRVKADEWLDKRGSWDNSYEGTFGRNGWGWKAQEVLGKVGAGGWAVLGCVLGAGVAEEQVQPPCTCCGCAQDLSSLVEERLQAAGWGQQSVPARLPAPACALVCLQLCLSLACLPAHPFCCAQVRGKDFRHETTKKKRGSYKGGEIDPHARCSYKFESGALGSRAGLLVACVWSGLRLLGRMCAVCGCWS